MDTKVSKLTRMMKRLFTSSKEAAKKITLNYWKTDPFTWEKISVCLLNTLKAQCLDWDQESTPALHNQTMIFLTILLQQVSIFHHISKHITNANSTIELNTTA
jgi:hypothetical protein